MSSEAFSSSGFNGYFNATSDNTLVDEAVGNILYDLSNAPAAFWAAVSSDGGNIRVVNSAGDTAYSYEVSNFDSSAETGILFWDSSSDMATGSDVTWRIYAGGSSSLPGVTATLGRNNVWDANYIAVWHFEEDPSTTDATDSTGAGNNLAATAMESGDLITGKLGKGLNYDNTAGGSAVEFGAVASGAIISDIPLTLECWVNPDALATSGLLTIETDGTSDHRHVLLINSSGNVLAHSRGASASSATTSNAMTAGGGWFYAAGRWISSSSRMSYLNAVAASKGTNSVTRIPSGMNRTRTARFDPNGFALDGQLDEARISDIARSENYLTTHYNNKNAPGTFWTTGSWTLALEGSTSLSFTTTGDLTTESSLEGSTTLSFTTTGALVAKGALDGSTTLSFTPTGALVAKGALDGSTTLSFTPTGDLTAESKLEGSTTLSFTPTGALVAKGALDGSTTLSFTPTGALVAKGALDGSTTLSFTPTGALVAKGALDGSTTLSFTPTGTLVAKGALDGSTTLSFTPTGALVAKGALDGSTTLSFTPTGALTTESKLEGSTTLSFTSTGALVAKGALDGSTTLTFTPTGALVAKGALDGSTTLSFTPNGDLTVKGVLDGLTSLTFTPIGALVAKGALDGSTSLSFTPTGALVAKGALDGSTSLIFDLVGTMLDEAIACTAIRHFSTGSVSSVELSESFVEITDALENHVSLSIPTC